MAIFQTGHRGRLWLLPVACGFVLTATGQTKDFSGTTDDSIRTVITAVADRQLRTSAAGSTRITLADGAYPIATTLSVATSATRPTGIEWDYPWGVDLYGLMQTYRATGNTNYLNFVLNHNLIVGRYYFWLRSLHNSLTSTNGLSTFQLGTALAETFKNDTSSGKLDYCGSATAQFMEGVLCYSDTITHEQLEMALNAARYISGTQARLPDGTLYRPERNYTVWADDLYMSCPFLVRWYQYTGITNYLDDAVRQITNMAGYLQDTNGIWFHGYYSTSNKVNGIKWGRANGWAMVATTEVLAAMPTNHPARSNVLNILRRHIEGIKSVQQTSGRWRQILDYDDASNWEETSCTAMYSYCLARAVSRGWIDPTNLAIARKGFIGVCTNITTNGVVNGTCQGTSLDPRISYYLSLSRPSDDMHGRGVVLLAGAEILLQPKLSLTTASNQAAISWPGGVANAVLESSTNLAGWSVCTNPATITTNWQKLVTDPLADAGFYRLRFGDPVYPSAPVAFEAESLSWTTNGAAATLSATDTNASGSLFVTLNADGAGDYFEFTITNVPAGTYRLKLSFQSATHRGCLNLTVDGNPVGGTLDEYWYAVVYPLMDFGPVTFAAPGNHVIRLTIAGKHGASAGYTVTADRFILAPE
jgi:unsaturated rhamnogalacturonyl hydrolase